MLPQPLTVGTQVDTHGTHVNTSMQHSLAYEPRVRAAGCRLPGSTRRRFACSADAQRTNWFLR